MSETQNTTTTTDLSAFEVVEICKQMGLRQTSQGLSKFSRWEIAGYEIIGNDYTGDYTIEIDGDVLVEGNGGIVDALRDFLTAEA